MPKPCIGSRLKVFRMRRSSVPWTTSVFETAMAPNNTSTHLDCQEDAPELHRSSLQSGRDFSPPGTGERSISGYSRRVDRLFPGVLRAWLPRIGQDASAA